MLLSHPSLRDATGCLSVTAACSKLQHWFINFSPVALLSYFGPSLSLSSCSYSTRHSHPDCYYLSVPPFHSSLYKSVKHFGHSFVFVAPKIWNDLPDNVKAVQHLLPPSGKSCKLTCLQKPIHYSLPVTPASYLV